MGAKNSDGLTPKDERFARLYSGSGNASRSYAAAFAVNITKGIPRWVRENASRLLARPEIQTRLRELHEASKADTLVDHFRLVRMYLEAYECAKTGGDAAGMTKATTELAKLGGFIDRGDKDDKRRPRSPEEIRAEIERLDAEIARVSGAGTETPALPPPAGLRRSGAAAA